MEQRTKRPLMNAYLQAFGYRLLIGCIALPIALCLVGGMLAFFIPFAEATLGTENETLFLAGALVMACLAGIGFPAATIGLAMWLRVRQFDPTFTPLGLAGKPYALTMRQYDGSMGGREAKIRIIRGPSLHITLAGTLDWGMTIGTQTGLGKMVASTLATERQMPIDDPDFAHLAAFSEHKERAYTFLEDANVRAAILRLTRDVSSIDIRTLLLSEKGLHLTLHRIPMRSITPENARAWLDDAVAVLDAAERL